MLACALFIVAVSSVPLAVQTESAPRPNIVLIVSDDQGYHDAGFMGSKELATPALDALAASGVVLTAHYVQPVCSASRAALLTGRLPTRTGVYGLVTPDVEGGLPLSERTLAEVLRAAGYETGLCGKWHLGDSAPGYRPTRRGFEHQYGCWSGSIDPFTHERDGVPDWHRDDEPLEEAGYATELITREACRRIREKDPERPLFLVVAYTAVHVPLKVPEAYAEPYESLGRRRRTYAGMVAALDRGVGEIVAALRERGLLESTLIVFTSDNGGESLRSVADNSPLRAGKGTLHEGGIRALCCASWPGRIPAGQRIDEPVQIVDWFPTFACLAGAEFPRGVALDGLDILPVLTAGAPSPHPWILVPIAPARAALRVGPWKLVDADDAPVPDEAGSEPARRRGGPVTMQLFDLASDVGEQRDLAAEHPDRVGELLSQLRGLVRDAVPLFER